MCGIVGIVGSNGASIEKMSNTIRHRGPDDAGYWHAPDYGVGLGHRRLSILDLSPAGHQPMISASGRFVIVFNGEIYNHLKIRKEIRNSDASSKPDDYASPWRGHSDTETVLAGFESWGIEATLKKTVGMFALAVWDNAEKSLTLARDRIGEKPLYYGWNKGVFLFASELKALRAYPEFVASINRNAIAQFLRFSYIPAPHSIYRGIYKLWPGYMLTMRSGSVNSCPWDEDAPPFGEFNNNNIIMRPYWALMDVVKQGQTKPFSGTEKEATDELEYVLSEAVQSLQLSDVPLGAFLSGGVDSSTIVSLMQANSVRPVKTFTIGFHEAVYNEAKYAKEVARYLGTEHTELYITSKDSLEVIPKLPKLYDEPFSDSSQIPTFLVSQLAKQHVTVSLSGDGGDELFGGYNRYVLTNSIWKKFRNLPQFGRRILAHGLSGVSPSRWDGIYAIVSPLLPDGMRTTRIGDKAQKLAKLLAATSPEEIYRDLVSHWNDPTKIVVGSVELPIRLTELNGMPCIDDLEQRMMYLDAISYLPDDILVKVDRAAMGISLETRVPLLDHRVIEYAWRLPLNLKIRNGQGKWLLRQVLYRHVPKGLIERPKMGFSIPIDIWLRGPLREWAENLLSERRLKQEGFFNTEEISRKWQEHLSGTCNWQHHLWDVLMFQAWLDEVS